MQLLSKLKQLPKQNVYMAVGTLLNRVGSAAIPFLLIYLHNNKGFSINFAGFILSCYGLGALFSAPLSGWFSDRYGAYLVCMGSLLISGLLMLSYPIATPNMLLPATFLWGLFGEAYRPASQVIISHLCLPEQRKIAYALNRLAVNVGMSLAPLLGSLLLIWHYNAIFYLDGLTSILAAIFFYLVFWEHFKRYPLPKDSRQSFFSSLKTVLKDSRMLHIVFAMTLSLIIFFQHASTLSLFMVNDLHLTPFLFGSMFLLNTLLIIFIELPLNIKMADTRFNISLAIAALLIACGFGLYYFAEGLTLILAGVVVWTIGEMILFPIVAAYIMEIAPENYRGAYMGFYSVGVNIALISAPLIGTHFYYSQGRSFWLICFMIGIVSALLFYKQGKYEKLA